MRVRRAIKSGRAFVQNTFGTRVRYVDDVAREARARGEEAHMGRLFGICTEKGSELPVSDPRRKFKLRVVFQGNRVINQNREVALFQDLG